MRRHFSAFCVISVLCSVNSVGHADQEKIEEEIVHTLGEHPEYVNQIPLALTVLNKIDIDAFNSDTLSDLEDSIPSLNFGRGERRSRGEITIRGVGDYSRNIGTDARVAVYIDGVPVGRSSAFDQDLDDIASIEILRGPQSTLYGANAISGTIYLTTEQPKNENSYSVKTEAGNFNYRKNQLTLNGIVSDNLTARVGASITDKDGFIDNTLLNRDLQNLNRKSGFAKFRYEHDDRKLTFNARYLKENSDATNAVALEGANFGAFDLAPGAREVVHDAEEFENRELKSISIRYEQPLSETMSISYRFGASESEHIELSEEDYSPLFVATSLIHEDSKKNSHEIRLIGGEKQGLLYVAGLFYMDQKASTERRANAGPFFPSPNTSTQTPGVADTTSISLYGNTAYSFSNDLNVTAGLRYLNERKKINYSSIDTTGLFVNINNFTDDQNEDQVIPSLGLTYDISENAGIYSTISRGFKSGGWNADFISSMESFEFNSETATSLEAGTKTFGLYGDKLDANFVLFYTKFDDFQVFQIVPTTEGGTILSLTNAGEVTTKGLELDTKFKLENFTIIANLAYADATFDSFKNGGGIGVDYDGNDLPYAPELSYYLAINHQTPLWSGKLNTRIGYSYADEHFSNPNNLTQNTMSDRYSINFSSALKVENWEIKIWAENLTDELNLKHKTVSFLGQPRGYYSPPRTYGASVTYRN